MAENVAEERQDEQREPRRDEREEGNEAADGPSLADGGACRNLSGSEIWAVLGSNQ
jgi:hypothetical protein